MIQQFPLEPPKHHELEWHLYLTPIETAVKILDILELFEELDNPSFNLYRRIFEEMTQHITH